MGSDPIMMDDSQLTTIPDSQGPYSPSPNDSQLSTGPDSQGPYSPSLDDSQLTTVPDSQVPYSQTTTCSQDLFSQNYSQPQTSELSALASLFVPDNASNSESTESHNVSPEMAPPSSPYSPLCPRVTDSMLPDPTPMSQKYQTAMDELFQANAEIIELKNTINELRQQALSGSLLHAVQPPQMKTPLPSVDEPKIPQMNTEPEKPSSELNSSILENQGLILFRAYGNKPHLLKFLRDKSALRRPAFSKC